LLQYKKLLSRRTEECYFRRQVGKRTTKKGKAPSSGKTTKERKNGVHSYGSGVERRIQMVSRKRVRKRHARGQKKNSNQSNRRKAS